MNSLRRNCASIGKRCYLYTIQSYEASLAGYAGKSVLNRLKTINNFSYDYTIINYRCNYSFKLGLSNSVRGYSSRCPSKNKLRCLSSVPSRMILYSTSQPHSQLLGNIRLYSSDYKKKIKEIGDQKPPPDTEKLSVFQKFKQMYRDYWYVLIPVHCTMSVFWFGGSYLVAKSGVDIVALLEFLNINENLIAPFRSGEGAAHVGLLAVALALYKIATPLRYATTLGGTTVAINYLKKFGYIKPLPRKEELKEMYRERKDILFEKRQQIRENVIQHLEKRQQIRGNVMEPLEKTPQINGNLKSQSVVVNETFKKEFTKK